MEFTFFLHLRSSDTCVQVMSWRFGERNPCSVFVLGSDIAKHLSLPPVKLHCSMLAEDAIKAAVKDIRAKRAGLEAKEQQA